MTDQEFLERAVTLSLQSSEPVQCGVVIVSGGKIIAEAYNSQRADKRTVHHAEIKALALANARCNSRTLPRATVYASCQPCIMCLTALSYAKVPRIIFRDRMIDLSPDDAQSQMDSHEFIERLGFTMKLEHLLPEPAISE